MEQKPAVTYGKTSTPSVNDHLDRFLLTRYLIVAIAASIFYLGLTSITTTKPSTSPAGSLDASHYEQARVSAASTFNLESLRRRKALRRHILSFVEGITLAASAAFSWRHHNTGFNTVDNWFWLYLSIIYLYGSTLPASSSYIRSVLRQNSALLYLARWLIAVRVCAPQWLNHGVSLDWSSLEVRLVATTTYLLLIHLLWPQALPTDRTSPSDATRESYASLLGTLSFAWVDQFLITARFRNTLTADQIPTLNQVETANHNARAFEQSKHNQKRLLWRLLGHFRTALIEQALWAAVYGLSSFVPILLLQSIMRTMEHATDTPTDGVWMSIVLLFPSSVLAAMAESKCIWLGQKIGFHLRAVMVSEIYAKALKRPTINEPTTDQSGEQVQPAHASTGAILNLLNSDASTIANAGAAMHQVWGSVPVQVIVAIALLYRTLGISIFVGVALMLGVVPMNSRISQRFVAVQMKVMAAADGRIQGMTEVIRCIRIIKLFAWELHFEKQTEEKRRLELLALRSRYILWSIAASIWYGMPLFITFSSFFTYSVVLGKALTPSLAFTSLALFSLLKMPLDDFVGTITRIQGTLSSIQRVEKFLEEKETEKYKSLTQTTQKGSSEIGFEHATISWSNVAEEAIATQGKGLKGGSSNVAGFAFCNLDVRFTVGRLNLIVGATGSGKSSLLLALLGEMNTISGRILMPSTIDRNRLTVDPKTGLVDGIAYCAQEAWLTNDTIRNNITFGSPYVEERYKAVLEACALNLDLNAFDDGDLTQVGERGVALSGGQKQRIALARAIYSNAYHLLLDDCFSAVDSHTGTWIFEKALMGPLVRGRTVILATHSIALTGASADFVVVLENGRLTASGSPRDIKNSHRHSEFENLSLSGKEETKLSRPSSHSLAPSMQPIQPSRASFEMIQREIADGYGDKTAETEKSENKGVIPWAAVFKYLCSMGGLTFWSLLVLSFVGQQIGAIGTNWWVRVLCDAYIAKSHEHALQPTEIPQDVGVAYYFGIYGLIIILFMIIGIARLLLVSYGSLHASTYIHTGLTRNILTTGFGFFDKTAFGEIINRFSRDLQNVDQDLAVLALATLHFLVTLLGIITLIVVLTPAFLVPGIFIGLAYWTVGTIYIGGTRDLKQIEAAKSAPLSQHFGETLSGIITIRAFGAIDQYRLGNSMRVDTAIRPSFMSAATERWLAFRLGVVGALVSLFAGLSAVTTSGKVDPGAIGLSMSYAIVFSEHVLWLIRYHIANMNNIMALTRVYEYMNLPQEAPAVLEDDSAKQGWPSQGQVRFENISARYAPGSETVLRNVTFTANSLERVGIVGRTGAGKSSLLLTLLRGLEAEDGRILIDDVDIKQLGLRLLRQSLAIVPQDPTLFAGTLRLNLDPFDAHSDAEVLAALKSVGLDDLKTDSNKTSEPSEKQNNTFGLSFVLAESGSNISQGQRQLVCIARALLKAPKIVVLDEATASIDHETDLRIQDCMRRLHATVITVAHRLRTVVDYDRIVVLKDGKVMECDHPWVLLQNKNSAFYDMCKAAKDGESLFQLAENAWRKARTTGS